MLVALFVTNFFSLIFWQHNQKCWTWEFTLGNFPVTMRKTMAVPSVQRGCIVPSNSIVVQWRMPFIRSTDFLSPPNMHSHILRLMWHADSCQTTWTYWQTVFKFKFCVQSMFRDMWSITFSSRKQWKYMMLIKVSTSLVASSHIHCLNHPQIWGVYNKNLAAPYNIRVIIFLTKQCDCMVMLSSHTWKRTYGRCILSYVHCLTTPH